MKRKYQEDHHKIEKDGHNERAKHVNAVPYKRDKYKQLYLKKEDV